MDTSTADFTLPHNPTTGRFYKGGNIEALLAAQEAAGYPTAEWAGFGQWKKEARVVSETGPTVIIYMAPKIDKKTKRPVMKNGKPVLIRRTLRVFNIAQTEVMTSKELAA
jgi:antirestriction protein ArdC